MKSIPKLFVLLILLTAGLFTAIVLLPFAEKYIARKIEDRKTETTGRIVKEFMEEAYIKENYSKASGLYIPPDGFETFLSTDPISQEEYIEWYVRSVNLESQGRITHVQVVNVEKVSDPQQVNENLKEELFKATFHFIKENGEPVYYGPCCGGDGDPSPDWITYVIKTDDGYKIFETLPYIP